LAFVVLLVRASDVTEEWLAVLAERPAEACMANDSAKRADVSDAGMVAADTGVP
jgi:hypothetical protein